MDTMDELKALEVAAEQLVVWAQQQQGVTLPEVQHVARTAGIEALAMALPARAGLGLYCYHPDTHELRACVVGAIVREGWVAFWARSYDDALQYVASRRSSENALTQPMQLRAAQITELLQSVYPSARLYEVTVAEQVTVVVDRAHRPLITHLHPDFKVIAVEPNMESWLEQQRIEAEAREPEMAQLRAQREAERTLEWYADFWSALRDVIRVAAHMEKAVRAERTRNLAVVHNYMNQLPRMATRVNNRLTEILIRNALDDVREEMEDPSSHFQRGTTPTWYVCEVCGAAHVALYRKAASSHVELHCAQCVREASRAAKDPDAYRKSFVPAVPARGHANRRKDAAFYGLTSIPNLGCLWWESLPNAGVEP